MTEASNNEFSACDMATAAAQGFREGVASVRPVPPAAAVVMPERMIVPGPLWSDARKPYGDPLNKAEIAGADMFNLALDEVARLNTAPAEQSAMVVPECAKTMRYHANKIFERVNSAGAAYEAGRSGLGSLEDAAESALYLRNKLDDLLDAPTPEPASLWISVEDRLPDIDTPVWLYAEDVGTFFGMRESSTDGWMWAEGLGLDLMPAGPGFSSITLIDFEPTLWMPLPSGPEQPAKEVQS